MSFSYDTKSECAHLPVHSKIEALLELSAMARLNAAMVINRDGHHPVSYTHLYCPLLF